MTVTVDSLVAKHPEFAALDVALMQSAIDDAATEINATVWGAKADRGQDLIAADILARTPFGRQAGLVLEDGSTAYSTELARLRRIVGGSYRAELP